VGSKQRAVGALVLGPVIVLVLAVGMLSAAAVENRQQADARLRAAGANATAVAGDAATTTSTAPNVQTTTTRPVAETSTTSRPATTVTSPPPALTATPTTVAGPTTRSDRSSYGAHDPSAVEVPFTAGSTSWSGTTNGVTMSVRTDKATPRAGDAVQFDIDLTSPAYPCCSLWFLTGDGYIFSRQPGDCPGTVGVATAHFHTTHTYNLEGRYTFNVQASTGTCGALGPTASLYGTVEVTAGTTTAQGPALPRVLVDYTVAPPGHLNDPSWLSMAGEVIEDDGWIRSVTIDWGDGTAPLVFGGAVGSAYDPNKCTITIAGWPVGGRKPIFTGDAIHHYAAPGTYVVTTSARSTACDGVSAPQIGTAKLTWRV